MGRIVANVASGGEKNFRELFVEASKLTGSIHTGMKKCFTILTSHIFFLLLSTYIVKNYVSCVTVASRIFGMPFY